MESTRMATGHSLLINGLLREHVDTDFGVASDLVALQSQQRSAFLKIVACGSGNGIHQPAVLAKVLSLAGTDRPRVLYIGTPYFDRDDKFESGPAPFRERGCDVARLTVSEPDAVPPYEEMRRLVVDWADVILVSGGNSLFAMMRWKAVGLDLLIREAGLRGKVLCGGSAGAGCWFRCLQTDSLKPEACRHSEEVLRTLSPDELADWRYAKISGMAFVPAFCVPHYDTTGTNKVSRRDCAKLMMLEQPGMPAVGIDEKAAFVVEGCNCMVISGDGVATCHFLAQGPTGEVLSMPLSTSTLGFFDERTQVGSMLLSTQCCIDSQRMLPSEMSIAEPCCIDSQRMLPSDMSIAEPIAPTGMLAVA